MLPNLRAEMARAGISQKELADTIGRSLNWVESRLQDKATFPVADAILVKKTYFPELSIEYLFAEEPVLPRGVDNAGEL